MATIVSNLYSKMFTSELAHLECSCASSSMVFSVNLGSTVILSQTYYPDENHNVVIYDLDKLLETYIDALCETFSLLVDGTTVKTIVVITCRTAIAERANTFYTDFFFTPSMGERDTAIGRHETVTLYCDSNTSIDALCTYLSADGAIVTNTKHLASISGWAPVDVSPEKFYDASAGQLISYVIQAGARKARYRVLATAPEADPAFIFRNSFGCWETIHLTGAKQVTPSYTRSNALIEGMNVMYDIEETMSYKAHTGPLRPGMVPVALDLARSLEVYLLGDDGIAGDRITITDVDVKHTNEDNSIPDFSFTYRRADRRSAQLAVVRPPRVFDKTFDETYE